MNPRRKQLIKPKSIRKIYQDIGLHIQKLDYTCGPVSLLNVLSLRGDDRGRSEEQLASLCRAKPATGTSNKDMVRAAEALGLAVVETKQEAEISELEGQLDGGAYPIVGYRSLGGGGHYAVVIEYDQEALYLFDCAYGLLRIEKPIFRKRWRGQHDPAKRWFLAVK